MAETTPTTQQHGSRDNTRGRGGSSFSRGRSSFGQGGQRGAAGGRGRSGQRGKGPDSSHFVPQEFDQKLLQVARVARVTKGGRRFSFRATLIVGNKKGQVGVGVAKAKDVAAAVEKATRAARAQMIHVSMTETGSIPYDIQGKQTSARVLLRPAKKGRGIIAGGSVRTVCELAGLQDISAKMLGRSNNKLNNALATIKALEKLPVVAKKQVLKEEKPTETIKE